MQVHYTKGSQATFTPLWRETARISWSISRVHVIPRNERGKQKYLSYIYGVFCCCSSRISLCAKSRIRGDRTSSKYLKNVYTGSQLHATTVKVTRSQGGCPIGDHHKYLARNRVGSSKTNSMRTDERHQSKRRKMQGAWSILHRHVMYKACRIKSTMFP